MGSLTLKSVFWSSYTDHQKAQPQYPYVTKWNVDGWICWGHVPHRAWISRTSRNKQVPTVEEWYTSDSKCWGLIHPIVTPTFNQYYKFPPQSPSPKAKPRGSDCLLLSWQISQVMCVTKTKVLSIGEMSNTCLGFHQQCGVIIRPYWVGWRLLLSLSINKNSIVPLILKVT